MSAVVDRLRARPREQHEEYVFCARDGFWYRPAYTEGTCPLCGEAADGPAAQFDRSWLGPAALAIESVIMLTLVLVMYFRG